MNTLSLIIVLVLLLVAGTLYLLSSINPKARKRLPSPLPVEKDKLEAKKENNLEKVFKGENSKDIEEIEEVEEVAEEVCPPICFPPEEKLESVPELPRGYNDNFITIMSRDPKWIYAYWEISNEMRNYLEQTYGSRLNNSKPVLRLYDITDIYDFNGSNAHNYTDTIINDYSNNWYLNIGAPDRTYCIDLGRILNDGTFILVARSNSTSTPSNKVSDKRDPEWMLVSENERKLFARIGGMSDLSSFDLFDQDKE